MKTYLDWSEYTDAGMGDAYADIPKYGGDFAKAVAVCINSRQCESSGRGVMCPSFRLDEDSALSTGARVRLLKAALNGDLGSEAFLQSELVEAMDLCISCKGCKRECENNVDMSRIKIEYLAQLNASKGLSLRARLFSDLPKLLANYPSLARLTSYRNRHQWFAKLMQRLLGISAKVTLPEPVAYSLHQITQKADSDKTVVLFADTFCKHYSPEIVVAAVEVLNAAGNQVRLIGGSGGVAGSSALCCGRTYLSQGRVDEARKQAQQLLDVLLPYAEEGVPIIGLEPSCLLTLRDEYSALGLGNAAKVVASQSLLFEEYLAKELTSGKAQLPWRSESSDDESILVHGHCHQKAVGAMKSMRKVLKQVPGLRFEMMEVACCGMAGSFGIEAEHAEMAKGMAEQALLPALQQQPDAVVVSNGFSCRHQIDEVSDRKAIHLSQLLRSRLSI
ncbi:MAG: (Fe-S)-binding protein [Candidatus Thiodiazotropha sp. 6PLUC2]